MRKLLFILLLVPQLVLSQVSHIISPDPGLHQLPPAGVDTTVFYVDAINGDDSRPGYPEDSSWQTVSKVNSETFDPGDQILFNKGDTWNTTEENTGLSIPSSGTNGNQITFGAYGTGNKPILTGRDSIIGWDSASVWTQSGDAWYKEIVLDPHRLWTDDIYERRESETVAVDTLEFWYWSGDTLWVFSSENPATRFNNMEFIGDRTATIASNGENYITIDGLDVRGNKNVITLDQGDNWIIQNCDIGLYCWGSGVYANDGFGGGGDTDSGLVVNNTFATGDTLFDEWEHNNTEDAVAIIGKADNWQIYNNTMTDWTHAGLVVTAGTLTEGNTNLKFYDNTITGANVDYSRGFSINNIQPASGMEIYNITIINTGVRSQLNGQGIKFYNFIIDDVEGTTYRVDIGQGLSLESTGSYTCKDIEVFNGIIMNTADEGIWFPGFVNDSIYDNTFSNLVVYNCDDDNDYQIYTSDDAQIGANTWHFNQLFKSGIDDLVYYGHDGADDYPKTVTEWNAENGTANDSIGNNIEGDPLFVSSVDYHMTEASVGVDAGTDISGYTLDLEGRAVGSPPNTGPYDSIYADVTAPIAQSAEIGNLDTNIVVILFDEYLDQDSVTTAGAFTVTYGVSGATEDSVQISSDTVKVYMALAPDVDTAVLIDYAQTFPYLQDTFNNAVIAWNDTIVTNNVAAPSTLNTGIQGYWNFDETSGDVIDQVASNDLTVNGAVQTGAGVVGGSDSITSDITLAGTANYNYQEFTVSMWIKGMDQGFMRPFINADDPVAPDYGWRMYQNNDQTILLILEDGGSNELGVQGSDDVVDETTWHNIVFVYENRTAYLYVDGSLDNSNSWAFDIDYTGAIFQFFDIDGRHDEVGVWNRELTTGEITELWNSGNGTTYPF